MEITSQSSGFLDKYQPEFNLGLQKPDRTYRIDGVYRRATETSPRILGKLRWTIQDYEYFTKVGPPKSFAQLYDLVRRGVIGCTNGDKLQEYTDEWTRKYTNLAAEDELRKSTPQTRDILEPGNFVIFPFSGHNRPLALPEILFLNIHGCLSPSEPTSTRMFNNFLARRNLIRPGDNVLDLCSGSGITAIAASYINPEGQIFATDISTQATNAAKFNAQMHRRVNMTVLQSDMFEQIDTRAKFDVIFINPPFAPKGQHLSNFLQGAVHDYGFSVITKLFDQAQDYLSSRGVIYMLYEDIKSFGGLNAVEWANLNQENEYNIKTLLRIRRARFDDNGNNVNVPMVIYAIAKR